METPIPEWEQDPIIRKSLTIALEACYKVPFKVRDKNGIWPFLYSYYDAHIKQTSVWEALVKTRARFEEFTGHSIELTDLQRYLEQ